MLPCGTPDLAGKPFERQPLTDTHGIAKSQIWMEPGPVIPLLHSFNSNLLWQSLCSLKEQKSSVTVIM